ncbi:DoxX-like family protein [Pseudonocardia ammonioxydans]|uniref:DoxX-like family protein n=1 Tax=Pseudonocardia ammonioxydans TaxID=260086 RepID=A0A1I5E7Q4_PSUAM|nr:DoxX family protein [Pseudonocardia ammonioxydans]SFO07525.1 DoxX-like family protein [Pseudonocardia ammonioxydans]
MAVPSVSRPSLSPVAHRALWVLQILLGLFFVLASAAPKFWGDPFAVAIFDGIGVGQWLRYVVGALELAGGIGLMTRRFSGPAAVGLVLLMIGAALTQAFVLHGGALVVTPLVLGVLAAVIALGRRETLRTPR